MKRSPGNETTLKSTTGYDSQGGILGTEADIEFYTFKECKTSADKLCKPEIEGKVWKCPDQNHTVNDKHTVSCETFMFCLYGIGIVYIKEDGQVQGKEFLGNYVVDTVTGARLILDSDVNPKGIPLYTTFTMNGRYQTIDLRDISDAEYGNVAITSDRVQSAKGGFYKYVHRQLVMNEFTMEQNEAVKNTFQLKHHGSFQSGLNEFATADNRIEVALRENILCKDGENFNYYLGGKYVDILLGDGTVLACIVGDAKGNESGSDENGISHYDGSIVELMGINNDSFSVPKDANCDKSDILHGEDIVEIRVYEEKRLYNYEDQYIYYFSDNKGDMGE